MEPSVTLWVGGTETLGRTVRDHLGDGDAGRSLEVVSLARARDRLASGSPECIVVDDPQEMPGCEAVRVLRERDPSVPILYLTALGDDADGAVRALGNGATDVVEEGADGWRPSSLAERIDDAVERSASEPEAANHDRLDRLAERLGREIAARRDAQRRLRGLLDRIPDVTLTGTDAGDDSSRRAPLESPGDRPRDGVLEESTGEPASPGVVGDRLEGDRKGPDRHGGDRNGVDRPEVGRTGLRGVAVDRRTRDRRFEAIFNNTYQFTGLLEPDGTLVEMNDAALSFGGLERADLVGTPVWESFWFQTNDETRAVVREAVEAARSGRTFRSEVVVQGADREATIDFSLRPITDDRGTVTMLVAEGHDVSELKAYERRIETQRDDLELLNQVVRHDIRNDLQLVQAYARALEPHVDDAGRQALDIVLEAAENAIDLTATARNLAAVMLRETDDTQRISLERTLERQLEDIDAGYPEVAVTVEGTLPDVDVRGTDLLGAVFRNLLKNAIQHNDKRVPEVAVDATVRDGMASVRIADNGPGVRDSQKEEIFGKGEKGLESSGSGIGLYLVNTLVESYGGDVWVEDNDPDGAAFVVRLPVERSTP